MTKRRATALVAVCGLLAWMVWDTRTGRRIEQGLAAGQLGGLDPEETRALQELVYWIGAGGSASEITVNTASRGSGLRVLTVTPKGEVAFQCGPGNAVYNSQLDAILVHVDLVKSWMASEFGTHEVFSVRKVFPLFLLLHEFGHRERHGRTLRMYGPSAGRSDGRRLEDEADTYSLERLHTLARTPLSVAAGSPLARRWNLPPGSYPLNGFSLTIDLPKPGEAYGQYPSPTEETLQRVAALQHLPEAARLDLFTLSWMHDLPRAAMRGDSPYSSLHQDVDHATLVRRIRLLLAQHRAMLPGVEYQRSADGTWAGSQEALRAVERQLDVLEQMGGSRLSEVTLPDSISDLTWTPTALLLVTDDGNVYRVTDAELEAEAPYGLTKIMLSPERAHVRPENRGSWSTFQSDLWTADDGRIFLYTDSGIQEARDGFWRPVGDRQLASVSILSSTPFRDDPLRAVIWTGDAIKMSERGAVTRGSDHDVFVLEKGRSIGARRPLTDMFAEASRHTGRELVSVDVAAAFGKTVWLSVWSADDDLLGFADADAATLRIRRFIPLPAAATPMRQESTRLAISPNGQRFALLTVHGDATVDPQAGSREDRVNVFELTLATGGVRQVGGFSVSYSRVVALLPELPQNVIESAEFVDDHRLLIATHSWSPALIFDLRTTRARPLFFPSSAVSAARADGWAAYVPLSGGEASLAITPGANHRAYVVRPAVSR